MRILIIFFMVICFSVAGCNKFLDVPQRGGFIQLNTVRAVLQALDAGLMYGSCPTDGQTAADDYYLSETDYNAKDENARKMYLRAADAQLLTSTEWVNTYKKVNAANVALETLDKVAENDKGEQDTEDFKMAKGFALFLRANCFFELLQIYAAPYDSATAATDPGIPVRTNSDINVASERGTVQGAYDRIIADLKLTLNLVPPVAIVPTRPGKAAVYALLARIYLITGNYTAAGDAANECLKINSNLMDYNTIDKLSPTPFARFNKEVIFHCLLAAGSQITKKVTPELYNSYDLNDLRKVIFFKQSTGAPNVGTYIFSGNYEFSATALFNGTAVDEMLLIRAECYARVGKPTEAMADLNKLLITRYITGRYVNKTASTADDALTQVLTERRKELVNRNLRWSDLRRLNKDPRFAITIKRTVAGVDYPVPPNDLRYTLLLPLDVIIYGKLEQNKR